jgi:hypothetical protein
MGCPTIPGSKAGEFDKGVRFGPLKPNQAAVRVAGSTLTPAPWLEEIAIFFR